MPRLLPARVRRSGSGRLLRRAWPPSWLGLLWTTLCLLLSLHNTVQGTMTECGPSVKVECTNLCNNFFYGTKIRDEAQSGAHAGDAAKDRRGRRGAAPECGPGADHRERHRREGGVQRHTYYAHFPELKDLYQ